MASRLLTDEIWGQIKDVLPERPSRPAGGRPPIGDREVLTGVLFVLKTGIPWEDLPEEMGCGCGMTCLRRLRQWQECGAWPKVQDILQLYLRDSARYDWPRALDGNQQFSRASRPRNGRELEMAAEDSQSGLDE